VILGFMFCWNAFNYPLMLAGRQTFPVTVGAIQFISYEQVLWGQMAAATIVAALPQLLLSLMVQKYIVRGFDHGGGSMTLSAEETEALRAIAGTMIPRRRRQRHARRRRSRHPRRHRPIDRAATWRWSCGHDGDRRATGVRFTGLERGRRGKPDQRLVCYGARADIGARPGGPRRLLPRRPRPAGAGPRGPRPLPEGPCGEQGDWSLLDPVKHGAVLARRPGAVTHPQVPEDNALGDGAFRSMDRESGGHLQADFESQCPE
jgi:multiple sugar transport system permease protein